MDTTIEERKEDAKISAQAGVDDDLEDVAAGVGLPPLGCDPTVRDDCNANMFTDNFGVSCKGGTCTVTR